MQNIRALAARYRSYISQDGFSRNVLVMLAGTALGQFAGLLLAPLLTRIFTSDMFGVLGMFSAVVYILSVIAALCYEMALPLTRTEEEAANVLGVCIAALVSALILGLIIVELIAQWGGDALSLGQMTPYRWLLPIGFFCIGAYHVMVYYATKFELFSIIARTKVYQGVSGPISQIVMGLIGMKTWGLIIGFIIGQSMGITMLFIRLIWAPSVLRRVSLSGMKTMARRFIRFPLISSWALLAEAIGGSYILFLLVPLLYSNTIAGYIFLTDRVVVRPLLVISTSILQVYVGDMSKTLSSDPAALRARFLQLARHQVMIVSFWLIVVNLIAPFFFPILFGEEWSAAVPYLQALSLAYMSQMVMHALIHTLHLMERQGRSALWQAGRLFAVISSLIISHHLGWSALDALVCYSVVQALCQLILFGIMFYSIKSLQKEAHA